jgi:hypothetical protein
MKQPNRKSSSNQDPVSRRSFLQVLGASAAAVGLSQTTIGAEAAKPKGKAREKVIPGFEKATEDASVHEGWKPVSDRKIRVGLAGFGVCKFSAAFGFQNHPNVEVVAVTDIVPDKCTALANKVGCKKTYPSAEEMIKDDKLEAIFIATDAPSHARLAIEALKHGKHVASAVPAAFGSLEEADQLFNAVKKSGLKYMMFEPSYFHGVLYAMRELSKAGVLGKVV